MFEATENLINDVIPKFAVSCGTMGIGLAKLVPSLHRAGINCRCVVTVVCS